MTQQLLPQDELIKSLREVLKELQMRVFKHLDAHLPTEIKRKLDAQIMSEITFQVASWALMNLQTPDTKPRNDVDLRNDFIEDLKKI